MILRAIFLLVTVNALCILAAPSPKLTDSSLYQLINSVEDVKVIKNEKAREIGSFDSLLENYMKSNEIEIPFLGATVTFSARNLEGNEIDMKMKFGDGAAEARKKSKLKKVFVPILVFILLKAITLIPLALGILGLKTWNAVQLSFISFITSLGLAIWKLCGKLTGDHHSQPQIIHNAWEPPHHAQQYAARVDSLLESQQLAYNSYTLPPN